MSAAYDVYGGWHPNTLDELLDVEEDPYITPAGVDPDWVIALKAAAAECAAGHPEGLTDDRLHCGMFGCGGAR